MEMAWLSLLLALFASIGVHGQTASFFLYDFSQASLNSNGGLTFNGAASVADGTLTPDVVGQSGSIYFNTPIPTADTSFSVSLHVQIDTTNCYINFPYGCGDGLAFVVQNTADGVTFLPTYNNATGYGADGAEGLSNGFIIAFQSTENQELNILGANSYTPINQKFHYDLVYGLNDYFVTATYSAQQLTVTYSSNSVTTPQTVYDDTFDLYGSQALGTTSQYYVGFSAASDSGQGALEGHKVISVAFQACATAPCTTPTPVFSSQATSVSSLASELTGEVPVATSVSDVRNCAISTDASQNVQTGYQAVTTSGSNLCCTVRGLISSGQCTYGTCNQGTQNLQDFIDTVPTGSTTPSELCLPVSSCYAVNGTLTISTYTGSVIEQNLTFDYAPSVKTVYTVINSALLPAYEVSSNGSARRRRGNRRGPTNGDTYYACVYRGTYDNNACSVPSACTSTIPVTPYIIDTHAVSGEVDGAPAVCYAKCVSLN